LEPERAAKGGFDGGAAVLPLAEIGWGLVTLSEVRGHAQGVDERGGVRENVDAIDEGGSRGDVPSIGRLLRGSGCGEGKAGSRKERTCWTQAL